MINLQKIFFLAVLVIIFISILLLNLMVPYYNDDWVYSFIFGIKEFVPIKNISDLIQSQYNHYFQWGGRTIDHTILQLLLLLDPKICSIIKSLVFVFYIFAIYKICNIGLKSRKYNYVILFIIFLYVLAFTITFVQSILWTTGAANYLFGMTIVLLFIYPYFLYFTSTNNKNKASNIKNVLLFLFGFITGWTNENTIVAVLFAILFLMFFIKKIDRKKVPSWMFIGFLGLVFGFVLLLIAPGNYIRIHQELDNQENFNQYEFWIKRLQMVLNYFLFEKKIIFLILSYIILFIVAFFRSTEKVRSKRMISSLLLFVMAVISSMVMIAVSQFPERATFPMTTFFIIAHVILLIEIMNSFKISNSLILLLALFCSIIFCVKYNFMYSKASFIYKIQTSREEIIKKSIQSSNYNITLKPIEYPYNKIYYDFSKDSTDLFNRAYCAIYGLNSIRVE